MKKTYIIPEMEVEILRPEAMCQDSLSVDPDLIVTDPIDIHVKEIVTMEEEEMTWGNLW